MRYENKYSQQAYDRKKEVVNELNNIQNTYKFVFIEDPTNDSRESITLTGLVPVNVNWNEYDKTYNFYLDYKLPYVRYETYKKVTENYTKPNNIKVLSSKKVIDWIEYLIKVYEDLLPISQERVKKVNDFELQMKQLHAHIGSKSPYGEFNGQVVRGGIEFTFSVHDEAFISKDIKVHYSVKDTIENFLALGNNSYQEVKE